MAKVELKKPIVEEISANLEGAACVVLVDPVGLTVEQDTQLRKQMRAEGIVYKVYKNTMLNFAVKGTEFCRWHSISQVRPPLQFPKQMPPHRRESLPSSRRRQTSWRSKPVLWKVLTMTQRVWLPSLPFRPEKYFWEDCLEACRARLQTSPVCLTRSRRRKRKKQTGCPEEAA